MAEVLPKIARTRAELDRRGLGADLEVDGGIDEDTAARGRARRGPGARRGLGHLRRPATVGGGAPDPGCWRKSPARRPRRRGQVDSWSHDGLPGAARGGHPGRRSRRHAPGRRAGGLGAHAHVPQSLGGCGGGDSGRRLLRRGDRSAGRPARRGGRPRVCRGAGPQGDALHDPRALCPSRADPAVYGRHRGRRGGAGGGRRARSRPPGVGARRGLAARERGHRRRGGGRGRGRRAPGAVSETPSHGPALGRSEAGRHHGRAHRRARRLGPLAHRGGGAADAHRLRAESDAVLVGAGTVRVDDPELTVRVDPVPRAPAAARRPRPRARRGPGAPCARDGRGTRVRCSTSSAPRACCRCSSKVGRASRTRSTARGSWTATCCTSPRRCSAETTPCRCSAVPEPPGCKTCGGAVWCRSPRWAPMCASSSPRARAAYDAAEVTA